MVTYVGFGDKAEKQVERIINALEKIARWFMAIGITFGIFMGIIIGILLYLIS